MDFVIQVLAWLLMIGIISLLIIVHEFGHFLVARLFGFQTPVFGVGLPFGPSWTLGTKWGTEFRLHACLLGGYVAIPELGDETAQNSEDVFGIKLKPFKKFPVWQRGLVAFAGPGFNILFAYLIMLSMLLFQGLPTYHTTVHSLIESTPIAADAGVKAGDMIVSIDDTEVQTPEEAVGYLSARKSTEVNLHILRDGKPQDIKLTTSPEGKVGMVLIVKGPIGYEKIDKNPIEISGMAGQKLAEQTGSMIQALGMIGQGVWKNITTIGQPQTKANTPAVGIGDVHGILAVLKIGAEIARQDWNQLFMFTILISMDLAIINLVPFPPLDGYHLASQTFELLRGKPMSERVQGQIIQFGWVTIAVLFVVIMFNDVSALVTGKLDFKKPAEQKDELDKRVQKVLDEENGKAGSSAPKTTDAESATESKSNDDGTSTAEGKSTDDSKSAADPKASTTITDGADSKSFEATTTDAASTQKTPAEAK